MKSTLQDLKNILENRKIVLARELTKIHEEFKRGKISSLIESLEEIKGEFVLIISGNTKTKEEYNIENLNKKSLEEHYNYYEKQGLDKKQIIKQIAKDRNVPKNDIYTKFL